MRLRDEASLSQGIAEMGPGSDPAGGIHPGSIQVTKLTLSHSRYMRLRDRDDPEKSLQDLKARRAAQDLELHPLDHWSLALKGPGVQKLGEEEAQELNPLRTGVLANGNVRAKGRITCGGVYAELSKEVRDIPRPLGRTTLAGFEAILFKLQGGGRQYQAVLYTEGDGEQGGRQAYLAPFKTHATRECNVRIPFSRFRPAKAGAAPLDPAKIVELGVRFLPPLAPLQTFSSSVPEAQQAFGVQGRDGRRRQAPDPLQTCMTAKKAAEASLRASGLGYTIVRPGPLQEVAGGQRGLVIEQSTAGQPPGEGGESVSGGAISCADVADVCIRCLHDEAAFNKTFEVSQEVVSKKNEEMYELVATLPVDQRVQQNRSLAPALSRLEKNT